MSTQTGSRCVYTDWFSLCPHRLVLVVSTQTGTRCVYNTDWYSLCLHRLVLVVSTQIGSRCQRASSEQPWGIDRQLFLREIDKSFLSEIDNFSCVK